MKKSRILYITIIVISLISLYDSIFKSFHKISWILADALFSTSLILFVIVCMILIINNGGLSSLRFLKQKKRNSKTLDYVEWIQHQPEYPYRFPLLFAIVLMMISFILSFF